MAKDLQHVYNPRGAALQLLTDKSKETCISGSAGTGKSRAMMEKFLIVLLAKPGTQALLLRKTAVSLTGSTLVTWRKHVAVEAIKAGLCKWYGGSSEEAAGYRFQNGSKLSVGGLDNPDRVMSTEYDIIGIDEATEVTLEDWEKASSRLRNGNLSYTQIIGACNPNAPKHWLKQRCDTGLTKMLVSRHEDNLRYYAEDGTVTPEGEQYMARLDQLTGVRYLRLRKGIWAAADGVIYEEWDDTIHLIPRTELPREWDRMWAVDFGFTNPFVCQCWAIDPDGRMILEWEIYQTQKTVDQHAARILKHVKDHNGAWKLPKPKRIVCDHDAEGRVVFSRAIGISTVAAKKAVLDGIQAVQRRLRPAGDGKPRLMIMRDAVLDRDPSLDDAKKPACTWEEIPGYVWDQAVGKNPKEAPVKLDDHGCLLAWTPVATETGPMPIQQITPGKRVWTREGLREVVASGMTSSWAVLTRLELSDGTILTGTGNHPVWVEGLGFTRMDALQHGARVVKQGMAGANVPYVVSSSATGLAAPVFNLTVADTPEFYANGVLVHNCDAARYATMALESPGGSFRWL